MKIPSRHELAGNALVAPALGAGLAGSRERALAKRKHPAMRHWPKSDHRAIPAMMQ
jgi:hypothetical protein